jgi:asparagine synthase (glutamine-hydrolysing)
MFDRDRRQVIVFNGEIYNYLELRADLEKTGAVFSSGTDTEVILAAYRAWGPSCLDRFNGMWAFAIYDCDKRTLFLARDRMGIKPLYYYTDPRGRFYFASEVKAILAVLDHRPSMDVACVDPYMSFGYLPGEETFFKGIKRLLPGRYMLLDRDNRVTEKQFWDLSYTVEKDRGLDHYVEKGRALLEDAIDLRLRSDVPLGIFLSGGLDSSAVVGLLAPKVTGP